MAIVKIIDAKTVIARMGIQDYDGVSETIASSIRAAESRFQAILDTRFDPVSTTDVFFVRADKFPVVEDGYFRLRLKRAFVNPSLAVVVHESETIGGTTTVVSSANYLIDKQKGIVYIAESFANKYILVTYAAGFSDSNPPPDWLKEALLSYMPYAMNNHQPTNRNDAQGPRLAKVADISGEILAPYMRGTAWHYRPVA